jgi:hypothetical protein
LDEQWSEKIHRRTIDTIYVYQIALAPGDKAAVIDRNLPARSTFNATFKVCSSEPAPKFPDLDRLTKALQSP